jgi:hypothetical protein
VSRDPTTEPYTEISPPSLTVSPEGVTVTWIELLGQGLVRARVGVAPRRPGRLVVVDRAAPVVRPLSTRAGGTAWLVQHNDILTESAELRLVRLDASRARTVLARPHPYTGYFTAIAAGPDEVLVTGPEFDPDPARPTVRSLTLRLNPSCQ